MSTIEGPISVRGKFGSRGFKKGMSAEALRQEVRVVDSTTGAAKGSKLARFSLIPAEFLWAIAEHYGLGARKYADRNWEKGYKWSLTDDAMERHLSQFKLGERYDAHKPDCPADCVEHTGSHHLIAVAWHAIALYIFDFRKIGTDDLTALSDTPKLKKE